MEITIIRSDNYEAANDTAQSLIELGWRLVSWAIQHFDPKVRGWDSPHYEARLEHD